MYSFSTPLALSILHLSHRFRDRTFVESFGCRSLVTFQLISSEFSHIDDIVEIFLRTFVIHHLIHNQLLLLHIQEDLQEGPVQKNVFRLPKHPSTIVHRWVVWKQVVFFAVVKQVPQINHRNRNLQLHYQRRDLSQELYLSP